MTLEAFGRTGHGTRTPSDAVCVVFGGGQHARVLIDAMHAAGVLPPVAILDRDSKRWGHSVSCVPIIGGDERIPGLIADGVTHFLVGVGSTSGTEARRRLFEAGKRFGLTPLSVRHPSAICSSTAVVEAGSQLLAGCIVNTGAYVGENAIVNTGAIVEHDCVVEAHAHIATGVALAGCVRVGEGAHVGVGASVRQGIAIGPRSVIGAGSVVINDVPPNLVVVGVPARELRRMAA